MAVARQRFEVFRFPVMQSTFCFPNIAIITITAASLTYYFRPKGALLLKKYVGAYETSSL